MKKLIILLIISITIISFSQENYILENRKGVNQHNSQEVKPIKFLPNKTTQILKPINFLNSNVLIDTLKYPGTFNTNFGLLGQDWILQWFKAPADLVLKGFGVYCTDNPNDAPAEAKIVKVNWNESQLISQQTKHHGYYPASGSIAGITSFLDNPDRTGSWVTIDTTETEPFGPDIWSDGGIGVDFIPDEALHDYQWFENNLLFDIIVSAGEIFGVAVKNTSTVLDSNRIGFLAGEIGYPGWKFYATGRLIPGVDKGWWTREYTFDFQVAVQILDGGLYPVFLDYSKLTPTLSTDPRPVFATVTMTGTPDPDLIVTAIVSYSTDYGSTWNQHIPIQLNHIIDSLYTEELPGFPNGTEVAYYFEASDTSYLHSSVTPVISYYVYGQPGGNTTLVVFNGYNQANGYPQDYFFGPDIQNGTSTFNHDTWNYGQPPSDLFNNYT